MSLSLVVVDELLLVENVHQGVHDLLEFEFGYFDELSASHSTHEGSQQDIQPLSFSVVVELVEEDDGAEENEHCESEEEAVFHKVKNVLPKLLADLD